MSVIDLLRRKGNTPNITWPIAHIMSVKIYLAGPLFSEAERDWIRSTIQKIESLAAQREIKIEIIFPYDLITQSEIEFLS
jgi:hypothetical protein